jgi:hypothetical protein
MRSPSESSAESSFLSYEEATERAHRLVEEWNDEHTDRHDHYFEAVEEPHAAMLPDTAYAQVAAHALPATVHQYVIGKAYGSDAMLTLPVTSFYSRGDVTSRTLRVVDGIDIGREFIAKKQRDKIFAPQPSIISASFI